jgi:hypothetical protein
MKRILAALGAAVFLWAAGAPAVRAESGKTLIPFESDEAFRAYVKKIKSQQIGHPMITDSAVLASPPPPPPPAPAAAPAREAAKPADDSVTNTQEAGVDEGGIVKTFGEYFVILRRGRLFTVSTADGGLKPVDAINAYPPGISPSNDWYDEMLISGDRIIVIGYSYSRGGTEVNRFRIGGDGRLSFEDAYHLRSNDYYSSTNYASRLIGTRLIIYTPLFLPWQPAENFDWLPSVRRWSGDAKAAFKPMIGARQIYLPAGWDNPERGANNTLHTIMECDLAAAEMACKATGVLGPASRNFYVSAQAVYVWVTNYMAPREGRAPASLLYRMPLDGSAPQAVGTMGAPTDQFSFSEDPSQDRLNVLVRSEGGGDGMWGAESSGGRVALLQIPFDVFGDGSENAPRRLYRPLPSNGEFGYAFKNRFANGYVLYGDGAGWGRPKDGGNRIFVAAVDQDYETTLPLTHGVDRIEVMGSDAVVIGADARDLSFQTVELQPQGRRASLGGRYKLSGASQGETRSHAFFFKSQPTRSDGGAGLLGMPVARAGRPGHKQLRENSNSILFLRRARGQFDPLGELEASESGRIDDGCKASCMDWYGNARPLFWRNRIIALMGYELVEGEIRDGTRGTTRIRETRRVNFAPPKPIPAGR